MPPSDTTDLDLEARFFAVSLDMLCCLGFDGYFRRLSPSWERALGFTPAEMMARRFIDFVHPGDRERTLSQNGAVREGGVATLFENRYVCKDGTFRWLRWNSTADTSLGVIFAVARDVTDEKRAAAEREALSARLRSADAEVKALRALLPICSYCRRIRDGEDTWHSVETYLARLTATEYTHGICPSCFDTVVERELSASERSS